MAASGQTSHVRSILPDEDEIHKRVRLRLERQGVLRREPTPLVMYRAIARRAPATTVLPATGQRGYSYDAGMNGELAQCFALATHTSARLRGLRGADWLGTSHTTFQYVGTVSFDGADGLDEWVRRVEADAVDRVWLAVPSLDPEERREGPPASVRAAFAGGVLGGLLATGTGGSRLWQADWHVGDREAPESRIWVVRYQSRPVAIEPQRPDVFDTAHTLDQTLERAARFSERQGLHWGTLFTRARQHWSGAADPAWPDPDQLFPPGWPDPDSRRLAAMAATAWVFGGMGSWNDLGFVDQAAQTEYEQISRDLYAAVLRACVAAANVDLP